MDVIVLSDSDEDRKPFGIQLNKREIDSDSEEKYEPPSVKGKKKIKMDTISRTSKEDEKRPTAPKEKKKRTVTKRTVKKNKALEEESKNEVCICVSVAKLYVQSQVFWDTMTCGLYAVVDASSSYKPLQIKSEGISFEEWSEAGFVAQEQQIDLSVAQNIINLLDQENTIPFIARYRKELTGGMPPEKLRDVKESYDLAKSVKHKASVVLDNIVKLGKITAALERCIRCARSISELDHIYSPYKVGSKRTLAERARQLGLSDAANMILDGSQFLNIEILVNPSKKGLTSVKDVESGIQHIIADTISKDRGVLDLLQKLKGDADIWLETAKARAVKETKADNKDVTKGECSKSHKNLADVESKFENYFNFSAPIKSVKPYQVLAVNRGESLKVLSVKINIPDRVLYHLMEFCGRNWVSKGNSYPLRKRLIEQSVKDSYARLIQPLLVRQVRSELTQKAEHAAVEVFATNLKRLLLSPPVRGKTVLGIDPGSFRNGCKLGVTSHTGDVLATDVIYPPFGKGIKPDSDFTACKLKDLLIKHKCELIALGNGTACRETESYVSDLIRSGWFRPLDVKFTIVNEQGASIYSCSAVAQKEFPGTDPNVISAISLARRLQDPLAELVKVEPKHLGVGMYQHDVPEKQLNCTLDEVVVECVSFVGVDVNVASHFLLRKIAGLNSSRAEKIIEWRATNGSFINRQQLKQVKGIGPKTFEQCAGFIRIIPETAQKSSQPKKQKLSDDNTENPLDRTCIHPESYSTALRFIAKCGVWLKDLGKPDFIRKIGITVQTSGIKQLAEEFGVSETLIKLISEALMETPQHDLRSQFQEPLFRRSVTSLEDIRAGAVLTGRVQNVTHFGTFVDVGVGNDGLIPQSRLRSARLQLGDRIEVKVISVDISRCRISLDLIRIL
ncbi:hypothetical protein Cfor_06519 [Coptotermes formosanus]|uniref:S1 motif domain-containing protein n=1 Tax=Coptotermes formosanus TaxID=36987 RepID=A0A6L2QE66_COPFO|nr:hypothetical protein Cfor_06519 [Coptotermes formosanus]